MATIRIDPQHLQAEGLIDAETARLIAANALPDSRFGLFVNLSLIMGALAVAAGTIALVPDATTGLLLAIVAVAAAELTRRFAPGASLKVLSSALALMGVLGLAGWIGWQYEDAADTAMPALLITLLLGAGAVWFRSAFLMVLSVLALGAVFGTGTGYWHACYGLFVEEPVMTIAVFGALTAGLYALRGRIAETWQNLAGIAARTAFFLVNFAFWVGSLWGDDLGPDYRYSEGNDWEAWRAATTHVPDSVFSIGWPVLLIAIMACSRNGGFLSVTATVFLAIHAYTQYFETFGAHPWSLLIGGIVLVGLAVGAAKLMKPQASA
ncbi:hypothetical protein [uncultured Hyphomonas sp.]|uniref:hypothetical protein n=1 Tax=uncultured Hyphomonas sp. TaxID=225298 RepID=UPI002AAC3BD2|nr:hypothetical protein [uncultured Hyphomonas sp.]